MSATHDLSGKEAVEKLRELAENSPTCMFGSGLDMIPIHFCPMQVQQIDHQGCLWFFSGADSVHNSQIETDPRTQLIFCNPDKSQYLVIHGETIISQDKAKIEELWNPRVEHWFPAGPEDPNLTLLRVRPLLTRYWDTGDGNAAGFVNLLTSAFIDADTDPGLVDGKLDI